MRTLLIAAACAAGLAAAAAAETPQQSDAGEILVELDRTAFLVDDMDAALGLYRDALGMAEIPYTEPFKDPVLSRLLGFSEPVTMEIRVLDGAGQRIALMRPVEGGLQPGDPAPRPGAGVTLLMSSPELHGVAAAVEAAGGEIVRPPAEPGTNPDALYAIGPSGERLIVTWGVLD
mgnify:CR=1 FL=1